MTVGLRQIFAVPDRALESRAKQCSFKVDGNRAPHEMKGMTDSQNSGAHRVAKKLGVPLFPSTRGDGDAPVLSFGSFDRSHSPKKRTQRVSRYGNPPANAELKGARLSQNMTLRDAERAVSIRANYIEAIESGDTDGLPGAPYDIGFVRTYANFLNTRKYYGKDPEWYVDEYRRKLQRAGHIVASTPASDNRDSQSAPSQKKRAMTPLVAWRIAVAFLAVLALGSGWYGFRTIQLIEVADSPDVSVSQSALTAVAPPQHIVS